MEIIEQIKEHIHDPRFRPPAPGEDIVRVEEELKIALPSQLRTLYAVCDGFRESKGNAPYLLPLLYDDGAGSLLKVTKFYWSEWKNHWPNLDFKPFIFFGLSGADEHWGMKYNGSNGIIAYNHHMEDEYEKLGTSIVEVYAGDQRKYEEIDEEG